MFPTGQNRWITKARPYLSSRSYSSPISGELRDCPIVHQPRTTAASMRKWTPVYLLQVSDVSRECRSRSRCFSCGGRHHSSICDRSLQPTQNAGNSQQFAHKQTPGSTPVRSGLNPTAPPFGHSSTPPTNTASDKSNPPLRSPKASSTTDTSGLCVQTTRGVLLQTARAVIFNPNQPDQSQEVRVILDSGSQRSYITEQTKKSLGLTSRDKRTMSIITFGSREKKQQVCYAVTVGMKLKNDSHKELALLSVPLICEPLTIPSVCVETEDYG